MDQYAKEREEQAALLLAAKKQAASRKYNPLKRGPLVSKVENESIKKAKLEENETNKVECELDKENSFAEERAQMAAMLLAAKNNVNKKGAKKGLKHKTDLNSLPENKENTTNTDINLENAKNTDLNLENTKNTDMHLDTLIKDAISLIQNTEPLHTSKGISENKGFNEGEIAKKKDEIRSVFNPKPIIKIRLTKEYSQADIRNKLIEKGRALLEKKIEIIENMVYEEDLDLEVPDTEFHDFDSNRTLQDFKRDQVWAAYDDDDGMPRFYALVQKILSQKRFKIRISYLKSRSTAEFGHMSWIGSGFSKTCGDFRLEAKPEIIRSVNMFSHRVNFEKSPKGVIRIFPQKGEIWALYKNWANNWDACTNEDIIHEYEMVLVLEEYEKKKGIWVSGLVKVNGFKTVFKFEEGLSDKRFVKREEMFRFSHQVPAFKLDGVCINGGSNLDGCFELDPAALPVNLGKKEGLE